MPPEAAVLEFLRAAESGGLATAAPPRKFSNGTGYDAVIDNNRRKRASGVNRSEDQELTPFDRWRLYTAGRDIARNFPAVAFAVRKHLDYVSKFSFRNKTKSAAAEKFSQLVRTWARPENCDVAGRHGLLRMIRLAERSRTVDGDILIVKWTDGRLQLVEADRIRTPPGGFPTGINLNPMEFLHGVQTDLAGRAEQFCVCRRARASDYSLASGMFYFERMVPSDACWHHGYFDRVDQVRGVSPLAPAVNAFRDVYEGCDYALAKMKVSQFFGLVTTRESDQPLGTIAPVQPPTPLTLETQIYDNNPEPTGFKVDFGKAPFHLDLNKGDEAKFLDSNTPSNELQSFVGIMLEMGMKALDIPFSFYRENYTNYSGQRQAWIQYAQSAEMKRSDNIELLNEILQWRISLWIEDGELQGAVEDYAWEWVPTAAPWIDPLKEIQADSQALSIGVSSRQRLCREQGLDFFEVARELAAENKFLQEHDLPVNTSPANVQITEIAAAGGGP
ncbi:MAG: phage portal protein [Patescibacteria group bacterium]|nr:phage portal protein [Patescibacteria group bacterium]